MEHLAFWNDDGHIEDGTHLYKSRNKCEKCKRPTNVCLCHVFPANPVGLNKTKLFILQHPKECSRPLHTTVILEACIKSSFCKIFRGNRFPESKFSDLYASLKEKNTILMYPGPHAIPLYELKMNEKDICNIVLLDGTWKQAQNMYKRCKFLHSLPLVSIETQQNSEYVVRTQPNEKCLSTVECAAVALSHWEQDKAIGEMLLKPLRTMCQFQLDYGEKVHEPKTRMSFR
uniref:tRNA-uridine aminocarboxypropyltransferase 2-like isoform X1 n=1 Tax=Styela clava TaxID=7725 RepID=UPI00193AB76E|nr:tRNA-uridine aminocarboxypropyltransferase 2-like isoform X1 [Styela clava]